MVKPIDPAGFEKKFQDNIDPWNYTGSAFEHYKRAALLRACGERRYGRGLELGCAIGETTRALAHRCLRLLAVDSSATALREAARRLQGQSHVVLAQCELPRQMPHGRFDLIVASELVYYLKAHQLDELLRRLISAMSPGGRFVLLDHMRPFDDAAQRPAVAHAAVVRRLRRHMTIVSHRRHARFDVIAFAKPRTSSPRF